MNQLEYYMTDVLCENIIADFNPKSDMIAWLEEYKEIYNRINIQPGNLPAIADCNYEGNRYDHIAKFHSLYNSLMLKYQI